MGKPLNHSLPRFLGDNIAHLPCAGQFCTCRRGRHCSAEQSEPRPVQSFMPGLQTQACGPLSLCPLLGRGYPPPPQSPRGRGCSFTRPREQAWGWPGSGGRFLSWVQVTAHHPSHLLTMLLLKGRFQLSIVYSRWWLLRRQCLCFSGLFQLQERNQPQPAST